jgi:hypothetical protein
MARAAHAGGGSVQARFMRVRAEEVAMRRAFMAVAAMLLVASPSIANAQACISDAGAIVDALYRQILEREPDAASRQFAQELANRRTTVRQIALGLAKSPEHRALLWEPVVEATFRQIRGAAPERQHVQTVARNIADGRQTLDDVAVAFAAEETQAQNPDTAVIAMYRRLLGRDPSEADVTHFRQRFVSEGPAAVAQAIVASPEYRQRTGRNAVPSQGVSPYEGSIRALYRRLLGRDADPEGLAQWTRIAAESGFDAVVDRLVASPEYRQASGDQGVPGGTMRYCAPVGTSGR